MEAAGSALLPVAPDSCRRAEVGACASGSPAMHVCPPGAGYSVLVMLPPAPTSLPDPGSRQQLPGAGDKSCYTAVPA